MIESNVWATSKTTEEDAFDAWIDLIPVGSPVLVAVNGDTEMLK